MTTELGTARMHNQRVRTAINQLERLRGEFPDIFRPTTDDALATLLGLRDRAQDRVAELLAKPIETPWGALHRDRAYNITEQIRTSGAPAGSKGTRLLKGVAVIEHDPALRWRALTVRYPSGKSRDLDANRIVSVVEA